MEDISDCLITWMKTFHVEAPHQTAVELSDGMAIAQVLSQISPEHFNNGWLSKIVIASPENWRLKVSNLKKVVKGILEFHNEVLGQQISESHQPNTTAIAEGQNSTELAKLLQLVLSCAVNCDKKQEYIEIMLKLEEQVQVVVMNSIEQLNIKEDTSIVHNSSVSEEQFKQLTRELHLANETRELITSKCLELDSQVAALQEEKLVLLSENERLLEKLNSVENIEDPNTLTGRRYQQQNSKLEVLQSAVFKLEQEKIEDTSKFDNLQKEFYELQLKNEELLKVSESTRALKDELDVLRHTSDKVEAYESTIESYKKKLVEYGDLKRQVKVLEEKNADHVKQNIDLEDVVKKNSNIKSQVELFKKQSQELHHRLSEETRRADKNEFENKRLTEKFLALNQEKERLLKERDSLKETIDELKCSQFQPENVDANASKRSSGSLSDADMFEVISPEIKERLIRLSHENKMLKLNKNSHDEEKVTLLQTMLDESNARQNALETETRLGNQRIMELEGTLVDIQEAGTTVVHQEGTELKRKLSFTTKKLYETEAELEKSKATVEALNENLKKLREKIVAQQDSLSRLEEEIRVKEESHQRNLDKAKSVLKCMDHERSPDVMMLRNQLQEKEKLIANLERESLKEAAIHELESQLITTAFSNMSVQLQRKSAEERLRQIPPGNQTFLSRQRQATTKRLNFPGVATNEYFEY